MKLNTICCVCLKTKAGKGWENAPLSCHEKVSHGYCPECFQKTMQQFGIDPEPEFSSYLRAKGKTYWNR